MASAHTSRRHAARPSSIPLLRLSLAVGALAAAAGVPSVAPAQAGAAPAADARSATAPSPDPRVGLRAGLMDAGQAAWNLRLLSATAPPEKFAGITNSDLAFTGQYAIQGSYNGYQVWDISDPSQPSLKTAYYCPASQSDVSVFKNLLFVSGEGLSGRLDCGGEGVKDTVSAERLRGLRIFDISDISNPKNVGNVQTCRGSHTHTVLADPKDPDNVYVYISGSAGVRSPNELAGCVGATPDEDPNSALFRIEVIKVPLAHPEQATIVSSPRIFNDLTAPPTHGNAPADAAEIARARASGAFVADLGGQEMVLPSGFVNVMLDSVVKARNGTGSPTGADSAALRSALPDIIAKMIGAPGGERGPRPGPTQCHDITVYPAIGLAGGACEGYGLLLDISNPVNPVRIDAAADSNFSYWHSATFNNDGTKVLFSDEWGGGGQPKCRATDPMEWGADAIFTIEDRKLVFQSYYKLPAAQTAEENCVAHNGSMIPIPGRDVMVQAWYQGGISVFDWTDARNPVEIAYFDRGPVDSTRMVMGGSWSVYWYNGSIVSSEIARGLDIFELMPSAHLSRNELDAARTVHLDYLNAQGQPKYVWPPSFAMARAYVDQLERSNGLPAARIAAVRQSLDGAEKASGAQRRDALTALATQLEGDAAGSSDASKARMLAGAVKELASASP
ncbi:MAG: LVIVD repeat-containing protein [Gemmatimonadaceae bacterium]